MQIAKFLGKQEHIGSSLENELLNQVRCFDRCQGQEKQLLIITFEKFKIGRYITAIVTDPVLLLVEANRPYIQSGRQGYSRYRENVDSTSTPWMVPGERPNRFV